MRYWLSDSLITFRELQQARRDLLQKTNGLAALPLCERLWRGHLYRVAMFIKIEAGSAFRLSSRVFIRRCCKIADRVFGGDRWPRYLDARKREVEHAKAELRRLLIFRTSVKNGYSSSALPGRPGTMRISKIPDQRSIQ